MLAQQTMKIFGDKGIETNCLIMFITCFVLPTVLIGLMSFGIGKLKIHARFNVKKNFAVILQVSNAAELR
jgi:hypothetical protein